MATRWDITNRLVPALKLLVQEFPLGTSIFKEFVQNADDANASAVHFRLDLREHATSPDTSALMGATGGPSLLIWNDSKFNSDDREKLTRIAESSKRDQLLSVGRFGVGFNSVYAASDYPSYVSGDEVTLFDPRCVLTHDLRKHLDEPEGGDPTGIGFKLSPEEAWGDELRSWTTLFTGLKGFDLDTAHYEQTIFRLPLRKEGGEISQVENTASLVEEIFLKLPQLAIRLLLFSKHLLRLSADFVLPDHSEPVPFLDVTTANAEAVRHGRDKLIAFLTAGDGTLESLIARLKNVGDVESRWLHQFDVTQYDEPDNPQTASEGWLLVSGVYGGRDEDLMRRCQQMAKEAVSPPIAAVAAKVDLATNRPIPLRDSKGRPSGLVFCGLPINDDCESHLPIHINGAFALNPVRTGLSEGPDRQWNYQLCRAGVAFAYASLLEYAREHFGPESASAYYGLWPSESPADESSSGYRRCHAALHQSLCERLRNTASVAAHTLSDEGIRLRWVMPSSVRRLDGSDSEYVKLRMSLVLEGINQAYPQPPAHVMEILEDQFGEDVDDGWVQDHFGKDHDVQCPIHACEHPGLRSRESIAAWLEYVLQRRADSNDRMANVYLCGLPLAITQDGLLHTFGYAGQDGFIFRGDELSQRLMGVDSGDVIEEAFDRELQLDAYPIAEITNKALQDVIEFVPTVLASNEVSDEWLATLFTYLAGHSLIDEHIETLKVFRMFRDGAGNLHRPESILIPVAESPATLIACGRRLGLPMLIPGETPLWPRIAECLERHPSLFTTLDLPSFLRVLDENLDALLADTQLASDCELWAAVIDEVARHSALSFDECARAVPPSRLRRMPLGQTYDGQPVSLDHRNVLWSRAKQAPCHVGVEITLVRADRPNWARLYENLGIPSHSPLTVALHTLENAAEMTPEQSDLFVRWLFDNWQMIENGSDDEQREADGMFQAHWKELRKNTPLRVRSVDDRVKLAASSKTYMPKLAGMQELPSDCGIVDFEYYLAEGDSREDWERFFVGLGVCEWVQPADIIRRITEIVSATDCDNPNLEAVDKLHHIVDYVIGEWRHLHTQRLPGGDTLFQQKIKRLPWIPVYADYDPATLDRHFRTARLVKPTEAYLPAENHVAGAHAAIVHRRFEANQQAAEVLAAMGVGTVRTGGIVLRQLEDLLNWKPDELSDAVLEKLPDVYARIGQIDRRVGKDDVVFDRQHPGKATSSMRQQLWSDDLLRRLRERPCLLDAERKKLWHPSHTFRSEVAADLFASDEPLRIHLTHPDPDIDAAFTLLGRNPEVKDEHCFDYLREIGEAHCGQGVRVDQRAVVSDVLQRILDRSRSLGRKKTANRMSDHGFREACRSTWLPRHDWRLCEASTLVMDNIGLAATGGALPSTINFLHDGVSPELAKLCGIPAVSDDLTDVGVEVTEFIENDKRLKKLRSRLRNDDFHIAFKRLIEAEHGVALEGFDWATDEIELQLCKELQVRREFRGQQLDTRPQAYRVSKKRILLANASQLAARLADALNDWLPETRRLQSIAGLIEILSAPICELPKVLADWGIGGCELGNAEADPAEANVEDAIPADEQVVAVESPPGMKMELFGRQVFVTDTGSDVDDDQPEPAPKAPPKRYWTYDDTHPFLGNHDGNGAGGKRHRRRARDGRPSALTAHSVRATSSRATTGHEDIAREYYARSRNVPDDVIMSVVDYEQRHGRTARATDHMRYQLESRSDSDVRYIFIRCCDSHWEDANIELTREEFAFAKEQKSKFWLYVVEHVSDYRRRHVEPIANVTHRLQELLEARAFELLFRKFSVPAEFRKHSHEPGMLRMFPQEGGGIVYEEGKLGKIVEVIYSENELPTVLYKPRKGRHIKTKSLVFKGQEVCPPEFCPWNKHHEGLSRK